MKCHVSMAAMRGFYDAAECREEPGELQRALLVGSLVEAPPRHQSAAFGSPTLAAPKCSHGARLTPAVSSGDSWCFPSVFAMTGVSMWLRGRLVTER